MDSSYYHVQGHCYDLEIPGDCLPLVAFLEVEAMMGVADDVVPDWLEALNLVEQAESHGKVAVPAALMEEGKDEMALSFAEYTPQKHNL